MSEREPIITAASTKITIVQGEGTDADHGDDWLGIQVLSADGRWVEVRMDLDVGYELESQLDDVLYDLRTQRRQREREEDGPVETLGPEHKHAWQRHCDDPECTQQVCWWCNETVFTAKRGERP